MYPHIILVQSNSCLMAFTFLHVNNCQKVTWFDVITTRQRSCGKVMFSVVYACQSVCSQVRSGSHLTIMHSSLDLTVWCVKKRHEAESVYASESDFGWSQKVFQDHMLHWMVSEDLRPSKPASNLILDGVGRSSHTIHWLCMVSEDLPRPPKIWFWCINWFGFEGFQNPQCMAPKPWHPSEHGTSLYMDPC